jgi:hypothetical protein
MDARGNIEISNLTMQLIFSLFVFRLTFNAISHSSLHMFFSPGLNQKKKIPKTLFSLVDLSDILSHSHSLLSLVDHSPPLAQPHATTRGDRLTQRNTDRDREREREEIRPTHSRRLPISVNHRYSHSLSCADLSLSYLLMFR